MRHPLKELEGVCYFNFYLKPYGGKELNKQMSQYNKVLCEVLIFKKKEGYRKFKKGLQFEWSTVLGHEWVHIFL